MNLYLKLTTLLGGFLLGDMHDWISSCLPNIPDKLPSDDEIEFFFRHDRLKTMLSVHFRYSIKSRTNL